ncbi:hypothetical protein AVEN_258553-1 [Araneus ventricosus]|uniref:Uncharacterized protein n=1 Tax=Araneus ventricosus TaxID=182803 RepID=A0A4Y2WNM5_ARAVE|nr:hypothetical protein AVEN_258553-1 [Araneus ventricosus]
MSPFLIVSNRETIFLQDSPGGQSRISLRLTNPIKSRAWNHADKSGCCPFVMHAKNFSSRKPKNCNSCGLQFVLSTKVHAVKGTVMLQQGKAIQGMRMKNF